MRQMAAEDLRAILEAAKSAADHARKSPDIGLSMSDSSLENERSAKNEDDQCETTAT
jgi:hypothetical protein